MCFTNWRSSFDIKAAGQGCKRRGPVCLYLDSSVHEHDNSCH